MLNISFKVDSTTPLETDEHPANHMHIHWQGAAAQFILSAAEKHGGSFGQFLTDAVRFYFWYMTTTDTCSIVSVPHGKMSSVMRTEMDRIGAKPLELFT
jgi:hypothetical protein